MAFHRASATRFGILACCVLSTGCGGSSQTSVPFGSAQSSRPQSYATDSSTITVAGKITGVSGPTITVDTSSTCGQIHVETSGATIYANGHSLAVGTYATARGTGSCSTQVAATQVVLSSSLTTLVGKIAGTYSGGVTFYNSSCGNVHVAINAQSVIYNNGNPLTTGEQEIQMTGYGACSSSFTGTLISPPQFVSQSHVPTGAYFGATAEQFSTLASPSPLANYSQAGPYTTYGQTGDISQENGAGIRSLFYLDPNRVAAADTFYSYVSGQEDAFDHTTQGLISNGNCNYGWTSADRLSNLYEGKITQYVGNLGDANMRNAMISYIAAANTAATPWGIFVDDSGPISPSSTLNVNDPNELVWRIVWDDDVHRSGRGRGVDAGAIWRVSGISCQERFESRCVQRTLGGFSVKWRRHSGGSARRNRILRR